MKFICLVISALIIFSCKKSRETNLYPDQVDSLSVGWTRVFSSSVTDVVFVDQSNGVIASTNGLFKSSNGGVTWTSIYPIIASNLTMASASKFMAIDYIALHSSLDGGVTFQTFNSVHQFSDAFYLPSGKCILASPSGIFSTINDGSNLVKLRDRFTTGSLPLEQVFFFSEDFGWVSYEDSIYRTQNGGNTWMASKSPQGFFATVDFVSPVIGYANSYGNIFKTNDGGMTWTSIANLEHTSSYTDIDFVTEQIGYVCVNKRVYKTINGGQTWTTVLRSKATTVELHFVDENHGWVCDGEGVLRFSN